MNICINTDFFIITIATHALNTDIKMFAFINLLSNIQLAFVFGTSVLGTDLFLALVCHLTSQRLHSLSGLKLFQSLYNFTGTSAALLRRCLSYFRAIWLLSHPISRLWDFTISVRLVNRGPVLELCHTGRCRINHPLPIPRVSKIPFRTIPVSDEGKPDAMDPSPSGTHTWFQP